MSSSLELARGLLGRVVTVKIDRPMGSRHPHHGFHYLVNYGHVPGVIASDGEELDAYLLGVDQPVEWAEGVVVAVIHRRDDDDDKLVVYRPQFLGHLFEPYAAATTEGSCV